jgi:hypothetical protein
MDGCEACGRPWDTADSGYELVELRLKEALLLAEKMLRSSSALERMLGADLKQVLTGA